MCKKVVFVVFLYLSTMFAYSQAIVDNNVIYNHKCIALRQNFKGEGSHCMPSFGYSEIYYNVTEYVLKDILSEMIHNTGPFPINISEHLRNHLSEYVLNSKIEEYNIIIPIHLTFENDNFFNNDDTIKKITVRSCIDNMENDSIQTFDYCINENDLQIGENKKYETASDPCYNKWNDFHGGHRNSYTLTTSLIYDVPVSVEITNTKTDFNIDKNDKVRLKFGNFYKQDISEITLQYQINGYDEWKDFVTKVPITPNGEVEFIYRDIIQSDDYDRGIGKIIKFRVKKKMLDGYYSSCSDENKTTGCHFYLSVPDFTIVESRRSACDESPLELRIKPKEGKEGVFNNIKNTGCDIIIRHVPNYTTPEDFNNEDDEVGFKFYLYKIEEDKNEEDTYIVKAGSEEIESVTNIDDASNNTNCNSIGYYLNSGDPNNDPTKGLWEIKIQPKTGTAFESFFAAKQYFRMPAKLPAINIDTIQNDASSFADANNPYVYLKITDDDNSRPEKRLQYYVECINSNKFIDTICSLIDGLNEKEAKEKFNSNKLYHHGYSFEKYDSGNSKRDKEDYIRDKFYEWYNKQSVEIRSTIKIENDGNEPTLADWDISTKDYNILRTTHDEKEGNETVTYTYICKFIVGNTEDKDPSSTSYIRFKGNVANHIENYKNIDNHTYILSYETGIANPGLYLTNKFFGRDPNSSYGDIREYNKPFLANNSGINLLQYYGKGNGYYLAKQLSGGTGQLILVDMYAPHFRSVGLGLEESSFGIYGIPSVNYVFNSDFIVFQDGGGYKYVWYDGEFYNTYKHPTNRPNIGSFQEKDDDSGFTYWENGEKYFRSYSSFSQDELYEYFKTDQVINCPSNKFDNAWQEFKKHRNEYWQDFLKGLNNYKIYNIPKKDYLNKSTATQPKAFSGKMRIKDSDGCYSDPVDYVYKYYDLSFSVTVIDLPSSPVAENGKVKLTFEKGALAPYKCLKGETTISNNFNSNNTITVSNIGYQGVALQFIDSKNETITRVITIEMPFNCSATPQTCPDKGGIITIKKTSSFLNPNSIIIKCGNTVCRTISNPKFNNSKEEITGIPLGDYDVVAYYGDYQVQLNNQKIQVSDQSFSISRQNFPAEEIGGSGKVTITAEKADGDIKFTWVDDLGNTTYSTINSNTSTSYTKVSSDNLKITVTHNNCSVTTDYSYESPKIIFTKAQILFNENTKKANFDIKSSGNDLVDNYTLYLLKDNGQKTATNVRNNSIVTLSQNGTTEFSYEWNTSYYLYAVYNSEKVIVLSNEIIPKELKCNAVAEANNSMRCYGTDGLITLTGEDCEYSKDGGVSYTSFSNNSKISLATGSYTIDFRKISTADLYYSSDEDAITQITQTTVKTIKDVTVEEIKPLEYDVIATNVKCFNKNDGTITINDNETTRRGEYVTFSVKKGESTIRSFDDPKEGLGPNLYTVIIKDEGCINNAGTAEVEISQPAEALAIEDIKTTDPTCWNNDGIIEVKIKGGWNEHKGIAEGYYNVLLDEDPRLNELEESSFNSTENVIFENLNHKEYTIYVTDFGNCTISKDTVLYEYVNPKVTGALFDSVWCYGGENGTIKKIEFSTDDQVLVGDPMKMYYSTNPDKPSVESNWIDFSQTINNLKSDDYYIWLKDTNQCVSDDYYDVHVAQPDPLKISIIHQDTIIHEYGKKGGTVEVLVAGGNKGRFNIYIDSIVSDSMVGHAAWDIHETFKDIFMPDTTHKLYVQDHKECTDSVITGFMRQPDSPLMVEGIPHPAWCNGAEGSIKIIAKGGWGKYRYSCNLTGDTVAMRQPFDSVAASLTSDSIQVGGGLYVLTLIDSAGVMVYDTVLVTTPPALKADNLSRAAYCGSDGVIAVDISGGTAPYKIENDFGQETFRTAGGITAFSKSVPAGSYTVYIKDTNDCRFNVPVSIADSSVVVSIKRQYPTMRQYANGRLEAVAQRGHAPYTFLWTNRNTGETCANAVWNNVMAGTYSLVVSDGSGCEKEGEIAYLATNGDLPLTIDAVEGETAPNAKNGWARFTSDTSGFSKMMLHSALGGDIDVIGNISNQLNFELTGLAPDSYVLECMLPEGEVRYAEFTIAKYEPIVLLVNNINHASQPDASDGSATLQITGGVAPYVVQMLHNDVFYDDTVLNGRQLVLPQLSAGTYAAIVIDKYGKRENTRFIIKEPDSPMQLTAESVQSPSCYGYSNGQIWLKAQGGWGDYEYALAGSDYSRTTMYGNRSAESYTFIAIDAKGVTDTLTVELSQPEPLRAGVAKVDSVSCFGLFDGGVTFDITGGTAPYYVEFDSLFTKPGNYIGSLNGGLHTFRFTDDKMCASDDDGLEVDVPQPEKLVIANDSVTPTTCNTDNGKIDIVIAGGIAPYTVKWKEDGLTVARLQGRTSIDSLQQLSLYSVVAVDANNCETEDRSYRMNRSSGPRINKVLTLPVLCYGDATGTAVIDSADITTAVPYSPFRIEWPHGENAMSVSNLPAGWNEVFVIDSNNCKTSKSFNVGAATPIRIQKIGSREPSCYGYTNGQINVEVDGGVEGFRYLWNTGDTLKDLTGIGKGSYTIMVTDRNNCHDSATYSIGQPDSLHVEIGEENVLMCPDNTYEFTATEGFKTYSWSLNDSVLSTKRNLIASEGGEYYLEATYGKNCKTRDTVTISIGDDLLEADFYMASDAAVDTSLALVELSNMQIDSLHWEFNYSDFVVVDSSDYELYLKPVNLGQHEITLWAYSGGCVSYKTKQVEISQLADTTHNINLGYNPLIKSITVMPNPTKGQFSISVKLRDEHNVEVSISSAGQGKPVERRDLSGKSEYYESFDLSNAGDGVYILRVVAGNEQRVAKVLIAK